MKIHRNPFFFGNDLNHFGKIHIVNLIGIFLGKSGVQTLLLMYNLFWFSD